MYRDLASNMNVVFNYRPQIKVHDLAELNKERLLNETYSLFQIVTEKFNNKESQIVILEKIKIFLFCFLRINFLKLNCQCFIFFC